MYTETAPPLPPAPQAVEEEWEEEEEDEDWATLSPYERERRRRAVIDDKAGVGQRLGRVGGRGNRWWH